MNASCLISFREDFEKIANGDMMAYLRDNPKEREKFIAEQRHKKYRKGVAKRALKKANPPKGLEKVYGAVLNWLAFYDKAVHFDNIQGHVKFSHPQANIKPIIKDLEAKGLIEKHFVSSFKLVTTKEKQAGVSVYCPVCASTNYAMARHIGGPASCMDCGHKGTGSQFRHKDGRG